MEVVFEVNDTGAEMKRYTMKVRSYNWIFAVAVVMAITCGTSTLRADTFEVTLDGLSYWYNGQQNMDIDLVIQPGDTVRWLWVLGNHNVVSGFPEDKDTGALFLSGPPTNKAGTIFEYTFLDPGEYGYHCHPHESIGMISFVTVISAPLCPWDLDESGTVDTSDMLNLFAQWGSAGPADFDGSGAVNTNDLLILFANWGLCK